MRTPPPLPRRRRLSKRGLVATLAVLAAPGLVACGSGGGAAPAREAGNRVVVVASFYPVAEIATRVGGDRVRVANLTPAGVEPHDLELTSRQVDQLEDADLLVYLGQGFQPAVAAVASRRDSGTVDLLDAVALEAAPAEAAEAGEEHPEEEHSEEADHGGHADESALDPHFWLDPTLLAKAADVVADALAGVDAGGTATFRANADTYKQELTALDAEMQAGLADCERRQIVTAHAAFHYLARRYELVQLPIAGLSPDAEPNPARLADLTDEIRREGITTVFFEDLVSPAVAEALAREAGVATAVLSPLEGLSTRDSEAGKDYAAVMRRNLAALREALGCR